MKISIVRVILFRLFELIASCTLLSAVCAALNLSGAIYSASIIGFLLIIAALAFMFINITKMVPYYQDAEDFGIYFGANIIAYLLFVVLSAATLYVANFFNAPVWFVWFFVITTAAKYCINSEMHAMMSLMIFHLAGFATVLAVPYFTRQVMKNRKF